MEVEPSKSRWARIFVGPILTLLALLAIWKNETRFDFYRASSQTKEIKSLEETMAGQSISFTGPMDRNASVPGEYVESFTGYLLVQRSAEIFAWDRDKDANGRIRWNQRWMSHPEWNARNERVYQRLSSGKLWPTDYRVGELTVAVEGIELVDSYQPVSVRQITIQREGLTAEGQYLYLRKGDSGGLGDERVSYRGIPVPPIATYFGKLEAKRGVPDTKQRRSGIVNAVIQDSGVLHHLVAGDRQTALATLRAYQGNLKWKVRGIASVATVLGVWVFVSLCVGWLYHIPALGRVVEFGSFLAALIFGLLLAAVTMLAAYFIAHPLMLLGIVSLGAVGVMWIRRRGSQSQLRLRNELSGQYGHPLSEEEMKELEFQELAQLVLADGKSVTKEQKFLQQFARKQSWDQEKYERLLTEANSKRLDPQQALSTDQHLNRLVRLAMADGNLSPREIRYIRNAASKRGFSNAAVRDAIRRVRSESH